MRDKLVIGTRKSALALWQSEFIRSEIKRAYPGVEIELKHVVTRGDKTQEAGIPMPEIGGKGLFTAELEECLLKKEIDLAVHSLKDLPTTLAADFTLGAIPKRAAVEDVVVSRSGARLLELPRGAVVGTSSVRRSSQILNLRGDLKAEHIRGNVDTRLRKARALDGQYDAIILARAGLERLGLEKEATEILSVRDMLPAPGQGALGVECRADDSELLELLRALHHPHTAAAVTAERAFLAALGAGCNTPVAALANVEISSGVELLDFRGRCLSPDGSRMIEIGGKLEIDKAARLGREMAEQALSRGFNGL
jgi:hydroxymethylbilane synthase